VASEIRGKKKKRENWRMTQEELRTKLMTEATQMVEQVLGAVAERDMKITEIEEVALEARQTIGERVAERLVEYRGGTTSA
jgi:hypothetical protein